MPTTELTQQLSFDYDALDIDPSNREAIKTRTWEIKDLARRTSEGMIQMFAELIEVKEMLPHGQFLSWLDAEFGWSRKIAHRFMRIAETFSNVPYTGHLTLGFEVLSLLAAPSTPEEVRVSVLERAISGEKITQSVAKEAIAAAKPKFQVGDWVSGLDFKNGGVVEGRIHSIGNKYAVLESGVNITIGTATILEPYPQTEDSGFKKGDLATGLGRIATIRTDKGHIYGVKVSTLTPSPLPEADEAVLHGEAIDEALWNHIQEIDPDNEHTDEAVVDEFVRGAIAAYTPDQDLEVYTQAKILELEKLVGYDPKLPDQDSESPFKAGDIVAGHYNPTDRFEVGELEAYSQSAYSLIVKANGDRCGVVTSTLRSPTAAEEEAYFDELTAVDYELEYVVTPTPSKLAVHHSSESPEHYTLQDVLDLVVACLGAIDLDPCSNSHHSPNVAAANHYTAEDDGLTKPWVGRVFLNPPYGRGIDAWIRKLDEDYRNRDVTEAIALVPARTDTEWFALLNDYPCCFVAGRIKFIGNDNAAPFPSALFYLGEHIDKFYYSFCTTGNVWQRIHPGVFADE